MSLRRLGVAFLACAPRGLMGRLAARFGGNAVHVPWSEVEAVTSVVTLERTAAELRLNRGDERRAAIVGKLPGA